MPKKFIELMCLCPNPEGEVPLQEEGNRYMKVVVINTKNNNRKYSGTLVSWRNGKIKVDIDGKIKTFRAEKWIVNVES